ncbi:hypothetical protein C1H76_9323 [Elsinoe australis]|uniref:Uncharacterized protein n=1 Tax=Elsinoe australis TaxID=40998 RepID=A0A4U7ASK9_9PEZI|nr:hypothetical protein C1H76_9323 [Elsinoe australis]
MATRLRKTFKYPTDDSDSDARNPEDELDDEQQEAIISSLREKDESSIKLWTTLFTALPLVAALFFLPSLFTTRSRDALISILSITCLSSTAYTMYFIPTRTPELSTSLSGRRQRAMLVDMESPVAKYLPRMNGGLASVLGLLGVLLWSRGDTIGAIWAVVPGAIYAVVMVARNDLVPMDIEALERMRYEYKGA